MRLRLHRAIPVLAALAAGLLLAGGPGEVRRDAAAGWVALQDRIEGPVPAAVPVAPGTVAADGRLRGAVELQVRRAVRTIEDACASPGVDRPGPARTAALRLLDGPVAELAAAYRAHPGASTGTGPLRLVVRGAADALALGCRDQGRARMLRRAVVRADRRA